LAPWLRDGALASTSARVLHSLCSTEPTKRTVGWVGSQLLSKDMVTAVGRAHDAAPLQIRSNPWQAIRSVLRHLLPGLDRQDDDGGVGVSLCECASAAVGSCADDWVGCTVVSRAAIANDTSATLQLAAVEDVAIDADRTMRVFRAASKVAKPEP
jgi:hypothetical protein